MPLIKLNAQSATALDATKLTGNLPAISGASLTGISAEVVKLASTSLHVSDNSVATIQHNGIFDDSVYSQYLVLIGGLTKNQHNSAEVYIRFVDGSNTVKNDSNYVRIVKDPVYSSGGSASAGGQAGSTTTHFQISNWSQAVSGTGLGSNYKLLIVNPTRSGEYTSIYGEAWEHDTNNPWYGYGLKACVYKNTTAMTGLWLGGNQNLRDCELQIYGYKL